MCHQRDTGRRGEITRATSQACALEQRIGEFARLRRITDDMYSPTDTPRRASASRRTDSIREAIRTRRWNVIPLADNESQPHVVSADLLHRGLELDVARVRNTVAQDHSLLHAHVTGEGILGVDDVTE